MINKNNIILLSVILFILFGCSFKTDKPENFYFFIENFGSDTIFQKSRLNILNAYAIKNCSNIGYDDTPCKGENLIWNGFEEVCCTIVPINRDNWHMIGYEFLLKKNESNWFAIFDSVDTNTMKYAAGWNEASEAWYTILFKRKNDKWYLEELYDYDNVFKY